MKKNLDSAIDHINERTTKICEFLHHIEGGKPVDEDDLKAAIHDCANVTASMHSLKRVVSRMPSTAGR
ncbi:hypothetical protein [Consotaella aegiceratis]|uniref:hypothetical protein n=1 Tax=Consotaella aegiceratis TaxID=3097961 RepID=UPI002F3FAA1F